MAIRQARVGQEWPSGGEGKELDEVDRRILALIQEDARIPSSEIADEVGMARSSVHVRLQALEEEGLIEDYEARLDYDAIGLPVTAFTVVRLKDYAIDKKVETMLCQLEECVEVHVIVGNGDFMVKTRTESRDALHQFLREKVQKIPGIRQIESFMSLHAAKETMAAPVPDIENREA